MVYASKAPIPHYVIHMTPATTAAGIADVDAGCNGEPANFLVASMPMFDNIDSGNFPTGRRPRRSAVLLVQVVISLGEPLRCNAPVAAADGIYGVIPAAACFIAALQPHT